MEVNIFRKYLSCHHIVNERWWNLFFHEDSLYLQSGFSTSKGGTTTCDGILVLTFGSIPKYGFFWVTCWGPNDPISMMCGFSHILLNFCVRSRAATTNSPSWTVQISSGKQNNNMPAVVQNDWSKIDAWKQGHCISNPNNALFYWKTLKITKRLQCLTPQMGNLMTTGNVTNFALSKVDPNFEQVHHFIASTWDVMWAVFAHQICYMDTCSVYFKKTTLE